MAGVVALTGASGFIGGALCQSLSRAGWRVHALVRRIPSTDPAPEIEWIAGDLANTAALGRLVAGADAVIHCAGAVRGRSAAHFERINVSGSEYLLQAARAEARCSRFLLMSSLAAREPALSWYAASKRRAEEALQREAGALALTIFRPTAVYGPGDRQLKPLLRFLQHGVLPVPGERDARVTLLHVHDLVAAVLCWLNTTDPVTGTFELHDGRAGGYTWPAIAAIAARAHSRRVRTLYLPRAVLSLVGKINLRLARWLEYQPMFTPEKLRELRHPDWICDNGALTETLGWQPRIDLERALRERLIG
ncbi:MAG TPA: NAD-dependent epimerase/dehydratase family protein [Nitrococcus sp.]|nr:NAD-dependent epimerase/dehydratase family protein [Nitrococcus sp.]